MQEDVRRPIRDRSHAAPSIQFREDELFSGIEFFRIDPQGLPILKGVGALPHFLESPLHVGSVFLA